MAGQARPGGPTVSGSGNEWFSWTIRGILGREKGLQLMRDPVNQKPVLSGDNRQLTEWVAHGKYPIGIASSVAVNSESIQAGVPIDFIDVKEPKPLNAGGATVCVFEGPHPNAARLFINWLLSKEGSTVFAQASEYPSTRVDVPTEG